jgi:hypothetical protein
MKVDDFDIKDEDQSPGCSSGEVAHFMKTGVYKDLARYLKQRIVSIRDALEFGQEKESEESLRGRLKEARGFLDLFPIMLEQLEQIETEKEEDDGTE